MPSRLIVDVSSLLRWTGPAVGIARVEHALAQSALGRPRTVLAYYDSEDTLSAGRFRALNPVWQDKLLGWSGALDAHRAQPGKGASRLLPGRQPVVAALERLRLTARSGAIRKLAGLGQRALLALRPHQFPLFDASGKRIANVPRELGLAEHLELGPGDTILSAGNGWADRTPAHIAALKARHGFRYVVLCYDMIPVTHPHFYQPEVARLVQDYWRGILPATDLVIVNALCIAADLRRFCATERVVPPNILRLQLGYDPPGSVAMSLPGGLTSGRYALFVSTIEPRKGHAVLLQAWRRLLAQKLPQQTGFRLVFVGRPGWMVDDVLAQLADTARLEGTVLHLRDIGDATLDALYAGAAFCLYPSAYEGFGLPIIEAFARGKAVLASSGGAVPETVGGLSPCLDPDDPDAWTKAMASLIENPGAREEAEAAIRAGFNAPIWTEAAAGILDACALGASAESPGAQQP
jgi:glycosyltransferase involved in cell wall biosynthesis